MPEDVWQLLDRPVILRIAKEKIVPWTKQMTMETRAAYMVLEALDELGDYISKLDETDKPSKRPREHLQGGLRACVFLNWPKMVFIRFSRFKDRIGFISVLDFLGYLSCSNTTRAQTRRIS